MFPRNHGVLEGWYFNDVACMFLEGSEGNCKKEKKQLKLLLEHSTGNISTEEYFKEANALGWETHDFYTACLLAVLTKSVASLEKRVSGIENKLERQQRFTTEKRA